MHLIYAYINGVLERNWRDKHIEPFSDRDETSEEPDKKVKNRRCLVAMSQAQDIDVISWLKDIETDSKGFAQDSIKQAWHRLMFGQMLTHRFCKPSNFLVQFPNITAEHSCYICYFDLFWTTLLIKCFELWTPKWVIWQTFEHKTSYLLTLENLNNLEVWSFRLAKVLARRSN